MICITLREPSGRASRTPCRVPRGVFEAKKGSSQAWDDASKVSREKNVSEGQRGRQSYGDGVNDDVVEGSDEDELAADVAKEIADSATETVVAEEVSDAATEKVVDEEVADAATEMVVAEEVAESVATEEVGDKEVARRNNGKGKAKCTAMDVEEEDEVSEMTSKLKRHQEEDPQEEEPAEPKKKPRKGRSSPVNAAAYHSPLFEKLGSRELFDKAEVQRVISESKKKEKSKENRYISPREAYRVLRSALTDDSTKSLVYGEVYFDRRVFEDTGATSPSSWHYKFLPYDAGLLGVKVGTRVVVRNTLGTVKSVKHNDVVIQVEGQQEQKETVLFVLEHALQNQDVTSLEKAQRKFIVDLIQIIALTHINATIFVENDGDRTHKDNLYYDFDKAIAVLEVKSKPDELESLRKYKDDVEKCNPMVWSVLSNIPAVQALHQVPPVFSNGLTEFMGGRKSLMEMLGFQHLEKNKVIGPDVPETGIFGKNRAILDLLADRGVPRENATDSFGRLAAEFLGGPRGKEPYDFGDGFGVAHGGGAPLPVDLYVLNAICE